MTTKKATFAAGCFWGVEAAYQQLDGVISTSVGYADGDTENPTYEDICKGDTGHAEVVEVEYNPEKISFEQLLDTFWANHDGKTIKREDPAESWQYRSVIYYHDDEQKAAAGQALSSIKSSGNYQNKVDTEIKPVAKFWPAEEYHQKYLEKKGQKSCSIT